MTTKIRNETYAAITEKNDALTADVKAKFLLQSHLTEWCDKLV